MVCQFLLCFLFFFFKQKTAYDVRISDWSSDVCSSDLLVLNDNPPASGADAVEAFLTKSLRTYGDGTPRTHHVSSNIIIEIEGSCDAAHAWSYVTTFQATEDLSLQPIACGRYRDRFALLEGKWVFLSRTIVTKLVGDLKEHRFEGLTPKPFWLFTQ